jgi:hypothetical protein
MTSFTHQPRSPSPTNTKASRIPLVERSEWRKQQTLVRQNAISNSPPNEFKAGTWGKGVKAKRTIMDILMEKGKYLVGFGGEDTSAGITRRENEMNAVQPNDILHMKDNGNVHYRGTVGSAFTEIDPTEFRSGGWETLSQLAWGTLPIIATGSRIFCCDIEWIKQPLSDDMKIRLNKLTTRGGGCTKQCGTIIKLA